MLLEEEPPSSSSFAFPLSYSRNGLQCSSTTFTSPPTDERNSLRKMFKILNNELSLPLINARKLRRLR
ncbi:hypothetical protein L2E82_44053 [Cichorium intybus]|uniref:Uncharacterized protein n=1 Tax=Cichorium intybus TaxID=13427 RepID=A0ACB8ZNS7_CICIN|nr:hypothetical protein L2E82_44053 [Cichorium intybus]